MMNYLVEIKNFERLLEYKHLPALAQLLWYKLMHYHNESMWEEWVEVENMRLMADLHIDSKNTFLRCRDSLIEAGLLEVQAGKKGMPTRYRIISLNSKKGSNFEQNMEPKNEEQEKNNTDHTGKSTQKTGKSVEKTAKTEPKEHVEAKNSEKEAVLCAEKGSKNEQNNEQNMAQKTGQKTDDIDKDIYINKNIYKLKQKTKTKNIKKNDAKASQEKQKTKTAHNTFPPDSFERKCVDTLITALKKQLPNVKVPETETGYDKWAKEVEKMKRIDKRSEDEISEALKFAITDPFWSINIRSTAKLRKQCEQLILRSRQQEQKGNPCMYSAQNRFKNFEQRDYDYDKMAWNMVRMECDRYTAAGVMN